MLRNKRKRFVVLVAAIAVMAGIGAAAQAESVGRWIEPSDEVVSPHIPWMKPA